MQTTPVGPQGGAIPRQTATATTAALTPAERLQAVDTAVTFLSAVASLAAVIVAYRALKEQIATPDRERRTASYHALVVNPALSVLPEFEDRATKLISGGETVLAQLVEGGGSTKATRASIGQLIADFNALLLPVTYRLLGAASAWGDPDLVRRINDSINALQDDVTGALGLLSTGQPIEPPAEGRVRSGVADVLGVVVHYRVRYEPVKGETTRDSTSKG